jgi:UDP-MurNAc hydroxylase
MRLTFITNACAIFEAEGFRLLSDPWLIDGVFEGSWCHCPPVQTRPEELVDVDAIYLSHIHPDHYDPRSMAVFDRNKLIIVPTLPGDFLSKALARQGFKNVRECAQGESCAVGPFSAKLFGPFSKHHMFDAEVGNVIDSAILLEHANERVLNLNDNIPTIEAARVLRSEHGPFRMAMLQYCAAGPYPSCFKNFSTSEMTMACDEVIERYLRHFTHIAETLEPDFMMPFAGDFVLGGSQHVKNSYLGTTTVDHAFEFASPLVPGIEFIRLNEGLTFDTTRGEITNGVYRPFDAAARDEYIEKTLSRLEYPHEKVPLNLDSLETFFRASLPLARGNLWRWQQRFQSFPHCHVYLKVPSGYFKFDFAQPDVEWAAEKPEWKEPMLACEMDFRLLQRIVSREAHWNNAEGGCHIDFDRRPNHYLPDVHTMMSFFQLPSVTRPAENS